jgi:hypothetical protein
VAEADDVCELLLLRQGAQLFGGDPDPGAEQAGHVLCERGHELLVRGRRGCGLRRQGVDQREELGSLAFRRELPGHCEGDQPAHGPAAEPVGSLRLDAAHLGEVAGRHLFDAFRRRPVVWSLEGIERLVRREMAGEVEIAEDVAADRMDAEEGDLIGVPIRGGFDGDERTAPFPAGRVAAGGLGERREGFQGRSGEQGCQREGLTEPFLDPGQQKDGEEGVAAAFEEVVVDADLRDAEKLRPDLGQDLFDRSPRRDEPGGRSAVRLGQGLPVHFAAGCERQGWERHDRRREHEIGQLVAQCLAERSDVGSAGDIGDEAVGR